MYILLTCDVCSISCYFVIYIQLPCSYEVKAHVYVDLKFQELPKHKFRIYEKKSFNTCTFISTKLKIWDSVAYSATPYPLTLVPLQGLYLGLTGGYDP